MPGVDGVLFPVFLARGAVSVGWSPNSFYTDPAATLDDLREAVTILEETEQTARRVFGGAHPVAGSMKVALRESRAVLRARETPPGSSKGSN